MAGTPKSPKQGLLKAMFKGIRNQVDRCRFRKAECKGCIDSTVELDCVAVCALSCSEKKLLNAKNL